MKIVDFGRQRRTGKIIHFIPPYRIPETYPSGFEMNRCNKCGGRLIRCWIGGTIPWLACPHCDKEELKEANNELH